MEALDIGHALVSRAPGGGYCQNGNPRRCNYF
jgi:hypothetical protein